jgi:hypothetical protein
MSKKNYDDMIIGNKITAEDNNISNKFMYNVYICQYIIYSTLYIITNYICGDVLDMTKRNEVYLQIKKTVYEIFNQYNHISALATAFLTDLNIVVNIIYIDKLNTKNRKLVWVCAGYSHINNIKKLLIVIDKLKSIGFQSTPNPQNTTNNLGLKKIPKPNKQLDVKNTYKILISYISNCKLQHDDLIDVVIKYNSNYEYLKSNLILLSKYILDIIYFKKILYYIISCNLNNETYDVDTLYTYFGITPETINEIIKLKIITLISHDRYIFNEELTSGCKRLCLNSTSFKNRTLDWLSTIDYNLSFQAIRLNINVMDIITNKLANRPENVLANQLSNQLSNQLIKFYDTYDYQFNYLINSITVSISEAKKKELYEIYKTYIKKIHKDTTYAALKQLTIQMIDEITTNINNHIFNVKGGSTYIADIFLASLFNNILFYALLVILLIYIFYTFYLNTRYTIDINDNGCSEHAQQYQN